MIDNIQEPNISNDNLYSALGLDPSKATEINTESVAGKSDIIYPLVVIKNLKTQVAQKQINDLLDRTSNIEDKEKFLNFYAVDENNGLLFWRTGLITNQLKNLFRDFLIDYEIYIKPKTTAPIEDLIVNYYDYIIPEIIPNREVKDFVTEPKAEDYKDNISETGKEIVNKFLEIMEDINTKYLNPSSVQVAKPIKHINDADTNIDNDNEDSNNESSLNSLSFNSTTNNDLYNLEDAEESNTSTDNESSLNSLSFNSTTNNDLYNLEDDLNINTPINTEHSENTTQEFKPNSTLSSLSFDDLDEQQVPNTSEQVNDSIFKPLTNIDMRGIE